MKNIKSKQSAPTAKPGNQPTKPSVPMSKSRQRIFSIIATTLPVVFLIFLELILRISGYGDNHSLFINHPDETFKGYEAVNPEIGKKYFQNLDYSAPAKDIFLKEKPTDVFRIFAMGSSSVVGFPYDNNLMFPRILSERLRDAYPGVKIEMVNTAITAINSFTLADFMPQILAEKPDAILIYAGHNEFYGAFGVGSNEAVFHSPILIKMHLKLMNFRVYQLVIKVTGSITKLFNSHDSVKEKRGTLMSRIIKDADITYGSEKYKEGINNYEQNLGTMLAMAEQKKVTVFISDLVSNLRDMKPFKSIASDGLKGAEDYYNAAKMYEAQGEIQKAKENYILARDYDCIRFRASTDINNIIKKLAVKYHANLVPTLDLFNSNSPNGIVGDNLLIEHVHPNVSGEFLLSESFYKGITDSKIIAANVNAETAKSFKNFRKNYGYSLLDSLIGNHRITNLKYHWPFRDESRDYVDYRQVYHPVGIIDSLAFNVMAKKKISLTEAHEFLAEKYLGKGDYQKAYQEYNSLTKINPYWSFYFRKAADCLLKMNDLPKALNFFERSTEYEDNSFYAHFRAGEICMIKNDLESALIHFQKAQLYADAQQKERTLIKIYQTLSYLNRPEEGNDIKAYFKKSNQSIPVPPKSYTYLNYIPLPVSKYVEGAKGFLAQKNQDKAVELLLSSLEIEETPIAFRILGELYYNKGEFVKSHEFLKKAYSEFKFEAQFLNWFIISSMSTGHRDDATSALEQLKKTDPNSPDIGKFQLVLKR